MNQFTFIGMAIMNMVNYGIDIKLLNKRQFKGGYAGFYISNQKAFEVATQDPSFFDVFVHEYCHFLQHNEDPNFFKKYGHCKFIQWLSGYQNQATDEEVDSWLMDGIMLEHDCEKRAINLIKKYKLPLDIEAYKKSANAYILSWWYAREFCRMPNNLNCVLDLVPNTIKNISFYRNKNNYLNVRQRFIDAK